LSEEGRAIADLAFELGSKYADRSFDDHEASMSQWSDLYESGFTGLGLPEEFGGGGGILELCIAAERLGAGGFPAAKLIISTAVSGQILARNGTDEQKAILAGHRPRRPMANGECRWREVPPRR